MKELDFIEIIKKQTKSDLIGDDCAYIKEAGIVITQDNFVEDVHFKREWASPWQIGYKAATVNISDILASGAKPAYLTAGLSIPADTNQEFIKEFFWGIEAGSYGAKLAGGDITKCDKIFISIAAIGFSEGRNISSRSGAKAGYTVITPERSKFGKSTRGLLELAGGKRKGQYIKAHLEPELNPEFSENIALNIRSRYAMTDTSDGLADALFKIAQASRVTIKTNYIEGMFGAEDYHLVAAVPEDELKKFKDFKIIGKVYDYEGAYLKIGDKSYSNYDDMGLYNHFGESV